MIVLHDMIKNSIVKDDQDFRVETKCQPAVKPSVPA
jgi:hypothetical protein